MKKHLVIITIFLFSAILIIPSCQKEDNPPKTKTELITQSNWKFKEATVAGTPYALPACRTDLLLTFNTNGTGILDEGATKCDPADPQTTNFNWSFQNNETEINSSSPIIPNGSTTLTLVSLTETELIVEFGYSTPGPGLVLLIRATFIH